MAIRLLTTAAFATLLAGAAQAQPAATTVSGELKNSVGRTVGGVTLTETPKGVLLRVEVQGLSPGWHGLHFHEKGDCSKSDFTSAGAHTHAVDSITPSTIFSRPSAKTNCPTIQPSPSSLSTRWMAFRNRSLGVSIGGS